MADGLLIQLSPHPQGLTVDANGRQLLGATQYGYVFQCPPMDAFTIQHQYNFTNYDTILDGQFSRWGSRQLATWQFDTLVMYLGSYDPAPIANRSRLRRSSKARGPNPSWVPFPDPTNPHQGTLPPPKYTPDWYRNQLWALHDSGAPFTFFAKFNGTDIGATLLTWATLTAFTESYKAGEGDAIYFTGVTFQEWRDPTINKQGLGQPKRANLPTTVELRRVLPKNPLSYGCFTPNGRRVPESGEPTLAQLAKHFYGSSEFWKVIARANSVRGGGPNTPLENLYPFSKSQITFTKGRTIKIPPGTLATEQLEVSQRAAANSKSQAAAGQ
jgi:hypothetical protein